MQSFYSNQILIALFIQVLAVLFINLASLCTADPDPTARLPAPPYTPAPPYHPPTLLHGQSPNPAAYGHGIAPAYPPPRQHPSADYGSPPSCAHQAEQSELKAFCLEDEVRCTS